MYCSRLKHFFRVNTNGLFTCCGHMVNAHEFNSYKLLQSSLWLMNIKCDMSNDKWPDECVRCRLAEESDTESIRNHSNKLHTAYYKSNPNYLILGGILDNKCNSACQSCDAKTSTLIGKLENNIVTIDNYDKVLPYLTNVVQLDINGGEPTISNVYKKLLTKIHSNTSVRINTNGITFFSGITNLLKNNRKVTITMSLDGVEKVHDYVRWPAKWSVVSKVHKQYITLASKYSNLDLNFWITLSALNAVDFNNIVDYANSINVPYSYGLLQQPTEINIKYKNRFTDMCLNADINEMISDEINDVDIMKFINKQDMLRSISYKNYYK